MRNYAKPDIYSRAEWEMVQGYMRGHDGLPAECRGAAYMHGYRNGVADRTGVLGDRADVLRRRADMILGGGNGQ
ncbi:hypothetical protein [Azorhizophilus paspali]|uniref:Uncharacterized protein n=1 Tax=Azorhizophilus paspali TaxID=69963 RepID=A0ABV6SHF1_AZOPA